MQLIQEGMELVNIKGAVSIAIVDREGLIDEHSQYAIIQFCH